MKLDLTTKEGLDNANKALMIINPILGIGVLGFRKLFASVPSAEEQKETAIKLIEEGKKNGVESMDIEISGEAGAHFSVPIEGVDISMGAGSKGNIHVHVKYK